MWAWGFSRALRVLPRRAIHSRCGRGRPGGLGICSDAGRYERQRTMRQECASVGWPAACRMTDPPRGYRSQDRRGPRCASGSRIRAVPVGGVALKRRQMLNSRVGRTERRNDKGCPAVIGSKTRHICAPSAPHPKDGRSYPAHSVEQIGPDSSHGVGQSHFHGVHIGRPRGQLFGPVFCPSDPRSPGQREYDAKKPHVIE